MQREGLSLGDLLARRLWAFVSKPAMAPRAGACSVENSPREIQDLFLGLSGSKVSALSNEIAHGLKNSYDLNAKGLGLFLCFFLFSNLFKAEITLTGLIIIGSVLWQVQYLFPNSGS